MTGAVTTARGQRVGRDRLPSAVLGLVVVLLALYAFCTPGACAVGGTGCPEGHGTHASAHVDPSPSSLSSPPSVALADLSGVGSFASVATLGVTVAAADVASAPHAGPAGHEPAAMLMMTCLAVLAVALSLLWPALVRSAGFLRLPRLDLARPVGLRPLVLDAGPPPSWQFSVIRC